MECFHYLKTNNGSREGLLCFLVATIGGDETRGVQLFAVHSLTTRSPTHWTVNRKNFPFAP